ncbi:2'-5'-RNA ligase [compost metagenome]
MSEKRRLFFALNATDPIAQSFVPFHKKLRINADQRETVVKWTPLDNYHVTVTFLGNTDVDSIPVLQETLTAVCNDFPPFELKVEDVGAFSSETDARVIWLGVQNKKVLNEFKDTLDEKIAALNLDIASERRDFVPHLTIGRLRNPKSVKDMISPLKRKSFGKIKVTEIILYESKMAGAYPIYTPLFRAALLGKKETEE